MFYNVSIYYNDHTVLMYTRQCASPESHLVISLSQVYVLYTFNDFFGIIISTNTVFFSTGARRLRTCRRHPSLPCTLLQTPSHQATLCSTRPSTRPSPHPHKTYDVLSPSSSRRLLSNLTGFCSEGARHTLLQHTQAYK